MKIFLQHKCTLLYFIGTGTWTQFSREARDFTSYDQAVDFAMKHELTDVQVVLKFADQPYNICLPFQQTISPSPLQL
jgi:hypothetical protein